MTDRAIKLFGTDEPLPERRRADRRARHGDPRGRPAALDPARRHRGHPRHRLPHPRPQLEHLHPGDHQPPPRRERRRLQRHLRRALPHRRRRAALVGGHPRDGRTAPSAARRSPGRRQDFLTCRTGFVDPPPAGRAWSAGPWRSCTSTARTRRPTAPELIDPAQCFLDVRAMTHEPVPGIRVTSAWRATPGRPRTTATGPTPRSRPTAARSPCPGPTRIPGGTRDARTRVTPDLRRHAAGHAGRRRAARSRCALGGPRPGTMPRVGLSVLPEDRRAALARRRRGEQPRRRSTSTAASTCAPWPGRKAAARATASSPSDSGAEVVLEVVIPGTASPADGARAGRGGTPGGRARARQPSSSRRPSTSSPIRRAATAAERRRLEEIYRARRAQAFPGVRLGGGMLSNFTELNRKRPPAELLDYRHPRAPRPDPRRRRPLGHGDPRVDRRTSSARPAPSVGRTPYRIGPSHIGNSFNPYGADHHAEPDNGARHHGPRRAAPSRPLRRRLASRLPRRGRPQAASRRSRMASPVGEFGIAHAGCRMPSPWFDEPGGRAGLPGLPRDPRHRRRPPARRGWRPQSSDPARLRGGRLASDGARRSSGSPTCATSRWR